MNMPASQSNSRTKPQTSARLCPSSQGARPIPPVWVSPLPTSALPAEGREPWVWEWLPFIHMPSCF